MANEPVSRHAVVAMYESQDAAEQALNALRNARLHVSPLALVSSTMAVDEDGSGLAAIGIPARKVAAYLRDLAHGYFLVLAAGSIDAIGSACAVLGATSPSRLVAHAA